ncbi:MAG: TIGR02996 domain-containing protein, partial [Gemmataceae bacterium]|nr:TIGR02996 domain-containing protein [Gemmataceae bacterium]
MTDHDALLRAVCDAPDDDTPRLVFADLLEDRGDHLRAHFVRTQVELARVPEYDPLWAKCRQFDPAVFLGWGMAHTLPQPLPTGFSWRAHKFRRGFAWLAQALTTEAVAARAGGLFDRAPVQALSFDDQSPNLAALADTPHLARLRRLEFTFTRLDAEDLAPLLGSAHAGGLAELVFERDAITPDGLAALAGSGLFGRLEGLELSHNAPRLSPVLLVDALGAAADPRLRKLGLAFAGLPAPDAATLFALPVVRGLDHLDLSNNPLGPDGVAALAEARGVRGVSVLKLG